MNQRYKGSCGNSSPTVDQNVVTVEAVVMMKGASDGGLPC